MKKIILSLLLFGIAALQAEPAPATPAGAHLFILSGQSNMQGHRPDEAFTPAVQMAFGADHVIVVQDALGGQPISRWCKDWKDPSGEAPASTGDLYDRLMAKVKAATEGREIASVSFFWMQGERDAKMKWGASYEAGLNGLLNQLATDLHRNDLNIVIGRLSDYGVDKEGAGDWEMVRDIQVKIAKAHPRSAWVDTDDLNDGLNRGGKTITNDLHYSAEGYKTFGTRMAEAAIKLIKEAPQK